jgi:predicted polyphosphate/ATP-dependent NAD kinase
VCESTLAGLAAGLVATRPDLGTGAFSSNKKLRVFVNNVEVCPALVDVTICAQRWIGAGSIWSPEDIQEIFLTFSEAAAIGISAIGGALQPITRREPMGLWIKTAQLQDAGTSVLAPIAPGMVATIGIEHHAQLFPGVRTRISASCGTIAMDGEREIEFGKADIVEVMLSTDGPITVDVANVLRHPIRASNARPGGINGKSNQPENEYIAGLTSVPP